MNNPFEELMLALIKIEHRLTILEGHILQMEAPIELPQYLKKEEAARIASVSTSTIDNMRRRGLLTPSYIGGSVRFSLSELLDLLNQHES